MTNLSVKIGLLLTIAALIGLAIIILIAVLEPKPYYQHQRTNLLDDQRPPVFVSSLEMSAPTGERTRF